MRAETFRALLSGFTDAERDLLYEAERKGEAVVSIAGITRTVKLSGCGIFDPCDPAPQMRIFGEIVDAA